jgi:hypothetical protein
MFIKKEERKIFYTQVAVWSLLFILPPLSSYIVNRSFDFVFYDCTQFLSRFDNTCFAVLPEFILDST